MSRSTVITLVDGVRLVVPDSLELITPYVLEEQEDWFEDEIKFLRVALRPGQQVIDIGANYGVYTLSMAQTLGPSGRVWAFEPASSTVAFLDDSVRLNGMGHVTVLRSALSSESGSAQLTAGPHAELNALVRGAAAGQAIETVDLTTLDRCQTELGWQRIDFIKIDAEGEEGRILEGGRDFFRTQSPLVMYEVKAAQDLHLELVQSFAELGYDSYRLVAGLNVLLPFDMAELADGFLLNLFACKPDRAEQLAQQGLLIQAGSAETVQVTPRPWQQRLPLMPYAQALAPIWMNAAAPNASGPLDEALSLHTASLDPTTAPAERYQALCGARDRLNALVAQQATHGRLCSLARVEHELGARVQSVSTLLRLLGMPVPAGGLARDEPFLPAAETYEKTNPGGQLEAWFFGTALEQFERISSFSSFYTGNSARPRLEEIVRLGFAGAPTRRRLELLRRRFG
jgi:FkbM family methyltransferase